MATATAECAPADAPPLVAVEDKREKVERSLWYWNASMAALHLVQAIIVLAGSQTSANAKNYKVGLTTGIPSWAGAFPIAAIQTRYQFPFAGVTSGFAFLSAAAHGIVLLCFKKCASNARARRQGVHLHDPHRTRNTRRAPCPSPQTSRTSASA